jgi:rubrerythrin
MTSHNDLIKIFEFALNQERTGKSFFEASVKRMGVGAAVSAFERLIQEEDKHIAFIQSILDDLQNERDIELPKAVTLEQETENFFDDRAKSEFLEQCLNESMVPDVTVFNTAWLIEKDLSDYYARMAQKTEGTAARALEMLSKWERQHEKFFREFRDTLSRTYAEMPWGG